MDDSSKNFDGSSLDDPHFYERNADLLHPDLNKICKKEDDPLISDYPSKYNRSERNGFNLNDRDILILIVLMLFIIVYYVVYYLY